jgi:hypothetical protein
MQLQFLLPILLAMSAIQCREKTAPPCDPIVQIRYIERHWVDLQHIPPITYAYGAGKPKVTPIRTFYYNVADDCEITRLD